MIEASRGLGYVMAALVGIATIAGAPAGAQASVARPAALGPVADPAPPRPPLVIRVTPPRGLRPDATSGVRAIRSCAPRRADSSGTGAVSARMHLDELARLATGRGQLVAVIDTGVAPHPLFGSRLRGGGDYLTGGNGLEDCDGHGTAVAGLIAAAPERAGRSTTPVGIAPQAQLISIRQSSPSFDVPAPEGGRRAAGDTATLAEAVALAVRSGADVVNISEAVCLPAARAAAAGASLQAALREAAAADVVVVAAAGNVGSGSCTAGERDRVALPGWYDADVLTVGAVGPGGAPAPFTMPGPWVDVAAPGTGMRSLAVGGGTTGGLDGTSFAAPWVAGLAALVRERFPELTAREVVDRILATARSSPGDRGLVGHGVVDPVAALTALPARLAPAPKGPVDAAALAAELPGTQPVPDAPRSPDSPLDLVAAAVLLCAAGIAVVLLRRSGRARLRGGGHVDHPASGGQVQGGAGREQA